MTKPLPIGIQSFEKLITGGFLYVDKTRDIYRMITEGVAYFLSRPRRFGKSLLISTLEAIFQGKRELFNGLWIDGSDYVWNAHPVIRIDFSQFRVTSPDELRQNLMERIQELAKANGLICDTGDYQKRFRDLIIQLSSQGQVVVLVDEYDKPIMDNIGNVETATRIRDVLKGFYEVLKGLDEYLRFVFLTGVSKFSKVGVFSGLNHLKDITLDMRFGALLGMTQEEVESCFPEYLNIFSQNAGMSVPELIAKIRHWYDGFCFSKAGVHIYNPFSLLMLLDMQDFRNYWFETGTPTFLIRLIRSQKYDVRELEDLQVNELAFSSYEIDHLDVLPILVQTGYLTIKGYDSTRRLYTLDYPNFEVRESFVKYLIDEFSPVRKEVADAHVWQMIDAMRAGDMNRFFEVLQIFFAGIPYDIQIRQERYYQTVFYLIFKLMGLQAGVEVRTSRGRMDAAGEGLWVGAFCE